MLKPERKALLDSLVGEGATLGDMQRKHGFNYKTVRKYYPDYRVGPKGKRVLEEKADLVEEMAAERAPGYLIAESVGLHVTNFRKHRPDLMWSKPEAASFAAQVRQMNYTNFYAGGE